MNASNAERAVNAKLREFVDRRADLLKSPPRLDVGDLDAKAAHLIKEREVAAFRGDSPRAMVIDDELRKLDIRRRDLVDIHERHRANIAKLEAEIEALPSTELDRLVARVIGPQGAGWRNRVLRFDAETLTAYLADGSWRQPPRAPHVPASLGLETRPVMMAEES